MLAGAAGVGKTRLAREALRRAARQGSQTRWAYGTASARSTPFGAFEGLLGGLVPDPVGIVRRAVESLGSLSGPRPLIAIDDAHELDELSALVVHNLVVRDAATVLVTLRSGEHAPDAVTSLWKDEHLPRLELQALSAAETTALLEQVLQGSRGLHRSRPAVVAQSGQSALPAASRGWGAAIGPAPKSGGHLAVARDP